MSSIKCNQCGLVNFASATYCKRCQLELNNFAPIADQRNYQTQDINLPTYQQPPPPPTFGEGNHQQTQHSYSPNCNKCGEQEDVSIQVVKKSYVPPLAYLGLLIGLLPALILIIILKVKYKINIPFCDTCWSKYKLVRVIEPLSLLCCFGMIGFAIYLMFSVSSTALFLVLMVIGFGIAAFGSWYKSVNSPKVKKLNSNQIIIQTKLNGDLVFNIQ